MYDYYFLSKLIQYFLDTFSEKGIDLKVPEAN